MAQCFGTKYHGRSSCWKNPNIQRMNEREKQKMIGLIIPFEDRCSMIYYYMSASVIAMERKVFRLVGESGYAWSWNAVGDGLSQHVAILLPS